MQVSNGLFSIFFNFIRNGDISGKLLIDGHHHYRVYNGIDFFRIGDIVFFQEFGIACQYFLAADQPF
ncbi:hypothetical protein D3C85_1240010 [compost metagenome]